LFGGGRDDGDHPPGEPSIRAELGPRTYLEFVGGSAAKFYATVMEEDPPGNWRVFFNFGRIGYPRDWAHKVEGVGEIEARRAYTDLIGEKLHKGYEIKPWPSSLLSPGGKRVAESSEPAPSSARAINIAARSGQLPSNAASVAGVELPAGMLLSADDEGGGRGPGPVLWVSERPLNDVVARWKALARVFSDTGLWPLVIEPSHGIDRMTDVMMDISRSSGADPFQLLRRWWHQNGGEDDEEAAAALGPFGRAFPGLAPRTPGDRPASIDAHVRDLQGHLGLVAVDRPAKVLDAIGWMGPANYDLNPTEQSAILDTWEDRFDAYLVGLGFDTISLAVGRPPRDLAAATAIAAEHFAFCPDNIWQGVGSISEYAPMLVGADRWDFWWD
jgi:hypothetical protein